MIPGKKYNSMVVFLGCWLILFVIYFPAAMAGRVGDFPGWVQAITTRSFIDYVNRTGSGIPSLYQFTQVVSYVLYQAFGANAWLWHLLYITLQALNTLLLFLFFRRLFTDSSVRNADLVALAGGLLFCLCPHISEVIVWESSFHYLLGLLLMLIVLRCAQQFIATQKIKFVWLGGLIFFFSTYCLEVFYLTPFFVLSLGIYYRISMQKDGAGFKKLLAYFTLPQALLFALHLSILRLLYHQSVAHIGSIALQLNSGTFSKSLKYIFHIVFLGRFFPDAVRTKVYHFSESGLGLSLYYGTLALVVVFVLLRYNSFRLPWKATVLVLIWVLLALGLILPLWFPITDLVIYDRYTYVLDAFVYIFIALLLNNIFGKYVFITFICLYALVNYRFTHRVIAYWQQSADIVNNLVATFPNDTTKKVLLLNLPECMQGVQMVGTRDDGEFRMLYNSVRPDKIENEVYDVEAYFMTSPANGAHVNVLNDSTIRVTLNQWGTWWVYYGYGATSYENKDFKVDMRDQGHWYDLILKHPASGYLLLYTVGRDWHKVDMNKKNIDQD